MNKFIAAAAFVAAQWQPAYAQAILGSIPEEFRGDWCWQKKNQRRGDLQARRVQAQGWFLEYRSHDPRHGPPILRFRQWDGERRHPQDADALHQFRGKATVDVRCPAQATAWQEHRTHHRADGSTVIQGSVRASATATQRADRALYCQSARAAAAAVSDTERKRLGNIVHTCGWLGAPGACRLWTGRHR